MHLPEGQWNLHARPDRVKEDAEQNLLIKTNTPLLQAIPLTDKKVVYRVEVMSKEEERKSEYTAGSPNFFLSGGLKKLFYEQQNK